VGVFKNRWWIVVASVLALIVGQGTINMFAAGVFLKAVGKELSFGRGLTSSAIGLSLVMTAIANPLFGRLVDRRGVRPVLLPAIVLFAIATAALSLLNTSVWVLFLLFAISGILGAGQTPTGYTKMVTARFDTQRGLALGVTLAGVGLGTVLIPQYCGFLLKNFGWRIGYLGLAGAIMVLGFIPVVLFCGQADAGFVRKSGAVTADVPGDPFAESVRTGRFWAITISMAFGIMAVNGVLIHVIPLLTDRGFPISAAAAALSASGIAILGGRVVAGYVLDKVFAPYIAIFFMICPMVGLFILLIGAGGMGPLVGTILLGLGVGAEIDLMSYMISCYFGLNAFGTIHGFMFAILVLAASCGATILGWCFQLRHSYTAGFILFEILLLAGCILLATLGKYKYPPRRKTAEKAEAVAAVAP
jgi:MFS family permease